jgi:hypothetical protein
VFASVSVSVICTPAACVVVPMKLLRMSLRTIPLAVRMSEVEPDDVLVPSAGYGPAV